MQVDSGYILLTPIACDPALALPYQVWRYLSVWLLRGYNVPLYLLGPAGTRADYASMAENDNKSELSDEEKQELIAHATLVVGVPNEYQWMAAKLGKHIITLYPEDIEPRQFFPFQSDKFSRCVFVRNNLQVATVLAGVRTLIGRL